MTRIESIKAALADVNAAFEAASSIKDDAAYAEAIAAAWAAFDAACRKAPARTGRP